jgi:hypothetical protein
VHAKQVIRSQTYNQTINMMSPALKGEVVGQMHHGWFQKVSFFQTADVHEKKLFLTELAMALKMEVGAMIAISLLVLM